MLQFFNESDAEIETGIITLEDIDTGEECTYNLDIFVSTAGEVAAILYEDALSFNMYRNGKFICTTEF